MHNQKGFSPILIIITIATIALLSFIAWRVWDTNQNKSTNNNQQLTSNQTSNTDTKDDASSQTTDPNQGYVVIKEWGVRFKPVEGLDAEDVVYATTAEYAGLPSEVGLSTIAVSSLSDSCNAGSAALGRLSRTKDLNDGVQVARFTSDKINEYYYQYTVPQSACSSDDNIDGDLTSSLSTIKSSIDSLEAAN